jgi:hypothetical protein
MTWTLYVWQPDRPLTVREAAGVLERLEAGEAGVAPTRDMSDLARFVRQTVEGVETSLGLCYLQVDLPDELANEGSEVVVDAADEEGLVVYDPQTKQLHWPTDESFLPAVAMLEARDGSLYVKPDADRLTSTLHQVARQADEEDPPFAILKSGRPGVFVQALCWGEGEWRLEHRLSDDQHQLCVKEDLGSADVLRVFLEFSEGVESWPDLPWVELEDEDEGEDEGEDDDEEQGDER